MAPSHMKLNLTDKPNLSRAMDENPELAKEVIQTFVGLMEESFDPNKGIKWSELPKLLHPQFTFRDIVRGILRGALDLKEMNPEAFDVLREEVHPLAMLASRKNYLDNSLRVYNWRAHFRLTEDDKVSEETVSKIIRRLLRYSRYVKIEQLAHALEYKQEATFRGLGERNVELLPFYPALRYQREHFGDLHVGKFLDDVGFLDCGNIISDEQKCPACSHNTLEKISEEYSGCVTCNAGFRI